MTSTPTPTTLDLDAIARRLVARQMLPSDGDALIAKCRAIRAENERLRTLVEYIKLQAQCHASEATTANSTIHEIYQVCTGATGEPGTWHGAEPVRRLSDQLAAAQERIKEQDEEVAALQRQVDEYQSQGGLPRTATKEQP